MNARVITVRGTGATNSIPGNNRNVNVLGSKHKLTFTGEVDFLLAEGSDYEVRLDKVKTVTIAGNNITVTYTGKQPSISVMGKGSTCKPR